MARYVVRSIIGYPIHTGIPRQSSGPPTTNYIVLDSAVCYRLVWHGNTLDNNRKRHAERLAARLNAEDDAYLASLP